nr:sulfite exporter TauE/SafE family protein [Salinimonas chungwhensis]
MPQFIVRYPWRVALFAGWLVLLLWQQNTVALALEFGLFTFLGVIGAIFANATGAGGGVVFVPFFHHMGFTPHQILATSFAIQCCGMTAGALTWTHHYRVHHTTDKQWQPLISALLLTVPGSVVGVLLAQWGKDTPALAFLAGMEDKLHLGFGVFSIFLALAIFASVPLLRRTVFATSLTTFDVLALPLIAFAGGIITAWLSVGVGELVAVYLIMRGKNITMAIAVAVILTACSVWPAIVFYLYQGSAIVWPVWLFAGAGAVAGGIIARRVVLAFRPVQLKLFFGLWVLLMGLSGIV